MLGWSGRGESKREAAVMARQKKTVEVDYVAGSLADARALVARVAKSYRTWSGKEGDQTTAAAVALAEARHAGYLYTGPAVDRPQGATTLAGYAELFGVSRAVTTFWGTLATAYARGVSTDSDTWRILCHGKAARASVVSQAVKRDGSTPTAIAALLKSEGWSVDKQGKVQHATRQGQGVRQGQSDKDATDATDASDKPADPYKVAGEALSVLGKALQGIDLDKQGKPVDGEAYRVIRKRMFELLTREDTLRGILKPPPEKGASKTATRKRTAKRTASLAPTGTDG
jgi:hypothetical protein